MKLPSAKLVVAPASRTFPDDAGTRFTEVSTRPATGAPLAGSPGTLSKSLDQSDQGLDGRCASAVAVLPFLGMPDPE
jgi:hypothetical protein